MDTCNLFSILEGQPLDPVVGIKVARLSGDDAFSLFGAEIAPGIQLKAHVHREGIEIYYILAGTGRMSLGEQPADGPVLWQEHFDVRPGDCFTVQPGQVHQLHNTGDTPMNALFGCSITHLTTDRTVLP